MNCVWCWEAGATWVAADGMPGMVMAWALFCLASRPCSLKQRGPRCHRSHLLLTPNPQPHPARGLHRFGWFGFNCGSTYLYHSPSALTVNRVALNMTLAAAGGGCTALLVESVRKGGWWQWAGYGAIPSSFIRLQFVTHVAGFPACCSHLCAYGLGPWPLPLP